MSTRANIKLTFGKNQLWLYAHYDGYPEHRGVDLATVLKVAWGTHSVGESPVDDQWFYNDVVSTVAALLIKRSTSSGDKIEITNQEHGDIEYLYEISANPDGLTGLHFQVSVVSRDEYGDNEHKDFYSAWVGTDETPVEAVIEGMKRATSNFNLDGRKITNG
jgi:hypothetical protein|tara:strand:- start:19229 stop:19714 length:486 start_codon:yes stop_codon:yes gene_type:complete